MIHNLMKEIYEADLIGCDGSVKGTVQEMLNLNGEEYFVIPLEIEVIDGKVKLDDYLRMDVKAELMKADGITRCEYNGVTYMIMSHTMYSDINTNEDALKLIDDVVNNRRVPDYPYSINSMSSTEIHSRLNHIFGKSAGIKKDMWIREDIKGLGKKPFLDSLLDCMIRSGLDKDIIKKIVMKSKLNGGDITEQEVCDIYNKETGESIDPEDLFIHREFEFKTIRMNDGYGVLRDGVEDIKMPDPNSLRSIRKLMTDLEIEDLIKNSEPDYETLNNICDYDLLWINGEVKRINNKLDVSKVKQIALSLKCLKGCVTDKQIADAYSERVSPISMDDLYMELKHSDDKATEYIPFSEFDMVNGFPSIGEKNTEQHMFKVNTPINFYKDGIIDVGSGRKAMIIERDKK